MLCKQSKAVKYTLELTNASLRTCHILIDVSAFQPDRRYPFQPRTEYTYCLPFFPSLWARHELLPMWNQTSREMAYCEPVFSNKTPPSGKISQCFSLLVFPEEWEQLQLCFAVLQSKLLKNSDGHAPVSPCSRQGCLPQTALAEKIFTFLIESWKPVTGFTTSKSCYKSSEPVMNSSLNPALQSLHLWSCRIAC